MFRMLARISDHFPQWNQLAFDLGVAIILAPILLMLHRRYEARLSALVKAFGWLSDHQGVSLLVVGLLPILLRVAMLPWFGVPVPRIPDEHSHLLLADTLLQGRLANPPHPLSKHLETFFVV